MTAHHNLSVAEAGRLMRAGKLRSADLTAHALRRIAALDGELHAFVAVLAGKAMAQARAADEELAQGIDRGLLHGIPYALKDIIDVAGLATTCGSRAFANRFAARDAEMVRRLTRGGAVLLGKLATYELSTVGPDFNTLHPPARNPRNTAHITGGSSSGCAAAVAAGFTRIAIGSDGGGSIRSPAAYCGCVGLKPTFGALPLDGFQPLSPTLDHGGVLTASVEDAALLFDVVTGAATVSTLGAGVSGLRLAYARNWSAGVAEVPVQQALDAAVDRLRQLGADVVEVDIPDYADYEACGTVIIQHEALLTHAELLKSESAAAIGRMAFQNLVTGAVLTEQDVARARQRREELQAAIEKQIFGPFDALVCASTLTTAPRFSDFGAAPRWTPMRTFPFNVTGHPALAMPTGLATSGLPMGLQLAARKGAEALLCRIGHALETGLHLRFPPIVEPSAPIFANFP